MSDILTKVGKQSITISYLDKHISFDVTVQNCPLAFTKQPQASCFALYSDGQTLCADVIVDNNGTVLFEWYRKNPNEIEWTKIYTSSPEKVEFGKIYTSTVTLPQNHYVKSKYYCKATFSKNDTTKSAESDVAEVVQNVNTGLPVIRIQTQNNTPVVDKVTEIPMEMSVNDNDNENNYAATIRIRGNATAGYPKKPYKIKLSSKEELLGMQKNKSWVLLANYCDKTLMRTAIGLKTSELLNLAWTPRFVFVELILNDEYIGNYQLTESVKEGKMRVNISDDGYLIELDGYYKAETVWFETDKRKYGYSFKYPDEEDITEEKKTYIKQYLDDFESTLEKGSTTEKTYQDYIDVDSWSRWFLVQNIIKNLDTNFFMYKNDATFDSKIFMGPVWDFEWSLGIGWYYGERPNTDHSFVKHIYFSQSTTSKSLLEYDDFKSKIKEIWENKKDEIKTIIPYMDELKIKLDKSQKINFKRWDILNSSVSVGGIPLGSYDAEFECDKEFLNNHIEWLSSQINNL